MSCIYAQYVAAFLHDRHCVHCFSASLAGDLPCSSRVVTPSERVGECAEK